MNGLRPSQLSQRWKTGTQSADASAQTTTVRRSPSRDGRVDGLTECPGDASGAQRQDLRPRDHGLPQQHWARPECRQRTRTLEATHCPKSATPLPERRRDCVTCIRDHSRTACKPFTAQQDSIRASRKLASLPGGHVRSTCWRIGCLQPVRRSQGNVLPDLPARL